MLFRSGTLSPVNMMDLSQIVSEIIESEHGHSCSVAKTGVGGVLIYRFFVKKVSRAVI